MYSQSENNFFKKGILKRFSHILSFFLFILFSCAWTIIILANILHIKIRCIFLLTILALFTKGIQPFFRQRAYDILLEEICLSALMTFTKTSWTIKHKITGMYNKKGCNAS